MKKRPKRKASNRKRRPNFESVESRDPPTNLFPIEFDSASAAGWTTEYSSYDDGDTVGGNDDDSVGGSGGG